MRLEKIEVEGLFHKCNHVIPMNTVEGVTIIHGLNGSGKTTLLELLNGIYSGSYGILQKRPFHILKLIFNNQSKLNIYWNYYFLASQSLADSNYDKFVKDDYYHPDAIIVEYISNTTDDWSIFTFDGSEFKVMKIEKGYEKDDPAVLKIKEDIRKDLTSRDFLIKISDIQKKSFKKNLSHQKSRDAKLADIANKMRDMENEDEKIKQKIFEIEMEIDELDKYQSQIDERRRYNGSRERKNILDELVHLKKELEKSETEYSLLQSLNLDSPNENEAEVAKSKIIMPKIKKKIEDIRSKINRYEIRMHEIDSEIKTDGQKQSHENKERKKILEKIVHLKKELENSEIIYSLLKSLNLDSPNENEAEVAKSKIEMQKIEIGDIRKKINHYEIRMHEIDSEIKKDDEKIFETYDNRKHLLEKKIQLKTNYAQIQSMRNRLTDELNDEKKPNKVSQKTPGFLQDLKETMPVSFIESERLFCQPNLMNFEKISISVDTYAEEIGNRDLKFDNLKKTFIETMESFLENKTVDIENNKSLVFFDAITGTKLFPEQLSSGERHLLIIFYNLIFNTHRNSFVLIDEPEISLHISWQIRFIEKIIEVLKRCEKKDVQILIATHSPNIVYDRDDLLVKIGE